MFWLQRTRPQTKFDGYTTLVLKPKSLAVLGPTHIHVQIFSRILGNKYFFPILKKGNDNHPNNYRGISLIDVLTKIFTGILNDRIYKYCIENNKIDEAQAGFRTGYSTTDNIFTLHAIVQNILANAVADFHLFYRFYQSIRHCGSGGGRVVR